MNDNPAMITALVESGAELEAWAKGFGVDWGWDETPLHEAAGGNRNPAVIAALLAAGADVDVRRDDRSRTPLHRAAHENPNPGGRGAADRSRGRDIDARGTLLGTNTGAGAGRAGHRCTPRREANPAVFMILFEAGADPAVLDGHGRSPLDYARENEALVELDVVKRSGR